MTMGKARNLSIHGCCFFDPGFIFLCFRPFRLKLLRIATLTDMSGPYAELAGWGNINAAKMAIEDFGGKVLGIEY